MTRFDPPGIRVLGKRWELVLSISDAQGQPYDLTGGTLTVALGSYASVSAQFLRVVATLADQTAEAGKATAVFTPAQTALITAPLGQVFYQADLSFGTDLVDTVACGAIRVQKSLI